MEIQLLTVAEGARELGLKSPDTLWTLIKRNKVPEKLVFRIGGEKSKKATTKIRKNILDQWISGDIAC